MIHEGASEKPCYRNIGELTALIQSRELSPVSIRVPSHGAAC
jgi:hypothetical protein